MNITKEKWKVNPDYGKENVYYVWDADSNYHNDTSPEAMDRRATLIAAAPELLAALQLAAVMHPYNVTFSQAITRAKEKRS